MNKKIIIIGITCGFLLMAGVCYSLTFCGLNSSKTISTSLSNENLNTKEQMGDNQNKKLKVEESEKKTSSTEITRGQIKNTEAAKIYVHICGAVKNPGVYEVKTGARICELIKLSGGLKKDAAGDYINQAQQVSDGERIYIPKNNELDKLSSDKFTESIQSDQKQEKEETSSLININTATAGELMTLPGIGQAKADSIIEYRKTNGNFKSIEDLMNITGIKKGVFGKISSCITTG